MSDIDTGTAAPDAASSAASATSDPAADTSSTAGPRLMRRLWFRVLLGALVPIGALVIWYLVTIPGAPLVSPSQFPSPESVWAAAGELHARGDLVPFILISLQRVLIGFGIGAGLGLVVGALVGLSRVWEALLSTSLGALRAVPSLAWVPLLILWLKLGEESKITLIAIGAFFPVFTTVSLALRHVDRNLVEAARAFGVRGFTLFRQVQLPSVLPSVVSGLRLALAQSWLFLVAAELLGSSMGLGFLLSDSQNNGRVDRLILAIILLGVIGKVTDSLISVAEKQAAKKWA